MELTAIQQELRTIEDVVCRLHAEIEKMKPRPEEEMTVKLKGITALASQHPLTNSFLAQKSEQIREKFVVYLAFIARADENSFYERMLYISRLSFGIGCKLTAEDILQTAMGIDKGSLDEACYELAELKELFVVEALVLANLSEDVSDAMLTMISDIALIMNLGKEELRSFATIARSVLTGDFDDMHNLTNLFFDSKLESIRQLLPEGFVGSGRILCGEYCVRKTKIFNKMKFWNVRDESDEEVSWPCREISCLKNGKVVQKGDVIVEYKEEDNSNSSALNKILFAGGPGAQTSATPKTVKKKICAPCDGIVCCVSETREKNYDAYTEEKVFKIVYVVSCFDNYYDACQWHEKKNKR